MLHLILALKIISTIASASAAILQAIDKAG